MDKEKILFNSKMLRAANDFSATIHSDGAQPFVDALFEEYKKAGAKDAASWLKSRLKNAFVYTEKPPKWVNEPEWPYLNGEPMVFICQYHIPMVNHMEGKFAADLHIFVFGAKVSLVVDGHAGWGTEYKIVEQSKD